MRPVLIGITVDNRDNSIASGRYESSIAYSRAVAAAGGTPLLLPQEIALAEPYVALCDALVFTGGADPHMEEFGQTTHAEARRMAAQRQAFELALLQALQRRPKTPVLGVCLGMQMMALHAGGTLHQYLPEILAEAEVHQKDRRHAVVMQTGDGVLARVAGGDAGRSCTVVSSHRQAVAQAGRMRVIATAPDGVVEAIDDPTRAFYLGVQWHPERGGEGCFNRDLFAALVDAGRQTTSSK